MADVLTATDQKAKKAVDHVSGMLINNNFSCVHEVVETRNKIDEFRKILCALDSFIKAAMNAHVDCSCEVKSLGFALSSNQQSGAKCCCETCRMPERAIECMHRSVDQQHHLLFDDTAKELHLCLGHRVWVKTHRSQIDELMQDLAEDEVMIVMDFKMKFDHVCFCEKTVDFNGNKGLSWHGSTVHSRHTVAETDAATEAGDSLLDCHITCHDHVSSGDSKQDHVAVLSCFEATCRRIDNELLHVRTIAVQSDNTKHCKKAILLLGFCSVAKAPVTKLKSCVHTGVQDGKGSIDAHFATAMRHVHQHCNMGHAVVTAIGSVQALRANGGLTNLVAEMIGINRSQVAKFEEDNKKDAVKKPKKTAEHQEAAFEDGVAVACECSSFGAGVRHNLTTIDEEEEETNEGGAAKEEKEETNDEENSDEENGDHVVVRRGS